jgi:hypothetical protein
MAWILFQGPAACGGACAFYPLIRTKTPAGAWIRMGTAHSAPPVRPFVGLLAAGQERLAPVRDRLLAWLGPVRLASDPVLFTHTTYYAREMGEGLWRQYVVFADLRDPGDLADWKLTANALENELGRNAAGGRTVNLDPGYLAPGKLVLATTKDQGHRLYLRNGIWAEMTLRIQQGRYALWPWTYPDYAAHVEFFDRAYQDYLEALRPAVKTEGA